MIRGNTEPVSTTGRPHRTSRVTFQCISHHTLNLGDSNREVLYLLSFSGYGRGDLDMSALIRLDRLYRPREPTLKLNLKLLTWVMFASFVVPFVKDNMGYW